MKRLAGAEAVAAIKKEFGAKGTGGRVAGLHLPPPLRKRWIAATTVAELCKIFNESAWDKESFEMVMIRLNISGGEWYDAAWDLEWDT